MGCEGGTGRASNFFARLLRRLLGRGGAACGAGGPSGGLFVVVASNVMGKEADIGRVLMKGFFETMKATGELPHTVFFMNSGVWLTTTDDEFVPLLESLKDAGVEIYSCGTCLKHYGLEEQLRVGHRGSTGQVIEGMRDMKTVWI